MNETIDTAVNSVNSWSTTLWGAMSALWTKMGAFVPNLLAFIVILVVGYLIAKLVAGTIRKILQKIKIDALSKRIGMHDVLERANVKVKVSDILSGIVFWLLMLTFMVSATESLGLPRVSSTIDSFVLYLPKILGAAFILMIGLFIAQFVRDLITSGAEGIGLDFARPLGSAAYGLLVIIVITLAIGQLELETEILTQVIAILLLSCGAAAAIAFGLGSKAVAGNILAGTYVRELYQEGDHVSIGDKAGVVTQVTAVKTELRTDSGDLITIANNTVVAETVTKRA